MQSCSGAGRSPGVMGLDIIDNVIPYIPKYVLVSHNTKMGAARGAILVAEYLVHQGHI